MSRYSRTAGAAAGFCFPLPDVADRFCFLLKDAVAGLFLVAAMSLPRSVLRKRGWSLPVRSHEAGTALAGFARRPGTQLDPERQVVSSFKTIEEESMRI